MEIDNVTRAVRAFRRVYDPIAKLRCEATEADAGFDGGEFSRGWHAAASVNEYNRTLARVAHRFGMRARQLHNAVCVVGMEEHEHRMNAGRARHGH